MTTTAAFLQNIRQRPHDDAPRLIFADWLEEQGDPRGAFIRLQCLRSGFGISDARKAVLLEQEQELLIRHRARWVGPLVERGIGWEFRRGLLHLRVDANTFLQTDWEELGQTETWQWVETTAIRFRREADIRTVAESPSLACMEALDLKGNGLGGEGVATLATSPHWARLQYLDLGFNQVENMGVAALTLSKLFAGLATLKLDDNHLNDPCAFMLAGGQGLTNLVALHLRWNSIGSEGASALAAARNLPRLAALHLGDNDIGDEGAQALAGTGLPQLTELRLEYNDIGAAAAAALRRRFGDGVHL